VSGYFVEEEELIETFLDVGDSGVISEDEELVECHTLIVNQ
jgi:hypothetical protein